MRCSVGRAVSQLPLWFLGALLLMAGTLYSQSADASSALLIDAPAGKARGIWADQNAGIRAFMGLPFARPPTGILRFRPPVPLAPWSGVRDAVRPGAACRQHPAPDAFVWSRGAFEQDEDCLYLNVWTGAKAGDKRAVMVWVHGGSHTTGFGHAAIFDGTELARQDVVLVTLNYRLGALGFLAHPALSSESPHHSSGNQGLLDVVSALEWVQANIAAFGGDPGNVTLFGQSAGSQTVCLLMSSPLGKGLFHKAIGQSASCALPAPDKDANGHERGGRLVTAAIGSSVTDSSEILRALRELPADRLLAAELQSGWSAQSRTVIDGWVVAAPARDTMIAGSQAQIPLLLGSAADEGVGLLPLNESLDLPALRAGLTRRFGEAAGETLLRLYADELEQSPGIAERAINADVFLTLGMREWADLHAASGQPVWLYHMAHVPPAFRLYDTEHPALELPGGPRSVGAYHSGDLAFVFANTRRIGLHWTEDDHRTAALMSTAWTRFAKTGDPNGAGMAAWPAWHPQSRGTMVFDKGAHVASGVRAEKLDTLRAGLLR